MTRRRVYFELEAQVAQENQTKKAAIGLIEPDRSSASLICSSAPLVADHMSTWG